MDLHVERCESCRKELLRVQEAVGMFAEAGREWSGLQAARTPAGEAVRSIRRRSMWLSLRPVAGFAAAAVAVFAVTLSVHHSAAPPERVAINHGSTTISPVDAAARATQGASVVRETSTPATASTLESAAPLTGNVAVSGSFHSPSVRNQRVDSAEEVAQDNALMAAIDAEITTPYTVADVSRPFNEQ